MTQPKPMDCTAELAIRLKTLHFKIQAMGLPHTAVLGPLLARCEEALNMVTLTQEQLAQIVHGLTEANARNGQVAQRVQLILGRVLQSAGGEITLTKEQLEAPVPDQMQIGTKRTENGGLTVLLRQGDPPAPPVPPARRDGPTLVKEPARLVQS